MQKLVKTLRLLLGFQVATYALFISTLYSSFTDGVDDFSGLGAILAIFAFYALGVVNLILLGVYLLKIRRSLLNVDRVVVVLAVLCIVCVIFYPSVTNWLEHIELSN